MPTTTENGSKLSPAEGILTGIGLIAHDFDQSRPESKTDPTWQIRLHAKADLLGDILRHTDMPDIPTVLAAWAHMKVITDLNNDYDVIECLTARLEGRDPVLHSED